MTKIKSNDLLRFSFPYHWHCTHIVHYIPDFFVQTLGFIWKFFYGWSDAEPNKRKPTCLFVQPIVVCAVYYRLPFLLFQSFSRKSEFHSTNIFMKTKLLWLFKIKMLSKNPTFSSSSAPSLTFQVDQRLDSSESKCLEPTFPVFWGSISGLPLSSNLATGPKDPGAHMKRFLGCTND